MSSVSQPGTGVNEKAMEINQQQKYSIITSSVSSWHSNCVTASHNGTPNKQLYVNKGRHYSPFNVGFCRPYLS
jgi:hypothetical protein